MVKKSKRSAAASLSPSTLSSSKKKNVWPESRPRLVNRKCKKLKTKKKSSCVKMSTKLIPCSIGWPYFLMNLKISSRKNVVSKLNFSNRERLKRLQKPKSLLDLLLVR
jgi:hypothetical protein